MLIGLCIGLLTTTGCSRFGGVASELAVIPHDGLGFASVQLAEAWKNADFAPIRQMIEKDPATLAEFQKEIGVSIGDIERFSVVVPAFESQGMQPTIVVTTLKAYGRDELVATLKATELTNPPAPLPSKSVPVMQLPAGNYLFLLNDRTYAMTSPQRKGEQFAAYVAWMNQQNPAKEGALSEAIALMGKHHIVIGGNPNATKQLGLPNAKGGPTEALEQMQSATITMDVGAVTKLVAMLRYPDEGAGAKAVETAEGLKALAGLMMPGLIQQNAKSPESQGTLKSLQSMLGEAQIKNEKGLVSVAMEGPLMQAIPTIYAELAPKPVEANQLKAGPANQLKATNNFKQIGLAMHSFHKNWASLPPFMPNTKQPVSWRVMLLPYLEADTLYKQYKLDEPWDSENNKKLIPLMPKVFELPGFPAEKGKTFIRVFQGNETIFPPKGQTHLAAITDGLSNTLLVVEAAEAVEWTRPDDLPYDAKKPLAKLGNRYGDGTLALYADGSVRMIPKSVDESTWRLLLQKSDGQPVPAFK